MSLSIARAAGPALVWSEIRKLQKILALLSFSAAVAPVARCAQVALRLARAVHEGTFTLARAAFTSTRAAAASRRAALTWSAVLLCHFEACTHAEAGRLGVCFLPVHFHTHWVQVSILLRVAWVLNVRCSWEGLTGIKLSAAHVVPQQYFAWHCIGVSLVLAGPRSQGGATMEQWSTAAAQRSAACSQRSSARHYSGVAPCDN